MAIGEFDLEPERGREPDWTRIADDLRAALVDPGSIRAHLAARRDRYETFARPTAARPADARVLADNDATAAATLVEVRAADGIGVLARITDAIASQGVRVEQAYVSTLGHEVVDTFYLRDANGKPLSEVGAEAVQDALRSELGGLRD